jgi:transcriptional regulator with XRE-family HTH domain
MAPNDHAFPELLRAHRARAGLTQRALADLSTISPRAIRDLEAGRANARTQTIHLLADGLRLQGLMRELFLRAGLSGRRTGPPDATSGQILPRPVNALLGRDTEVAAMVDALESGRRRIISISGLPGVGKTRVAAEVAARLSSRRGWPVLWIGEQPGATEFDPLLRSLRAMIESGTEDVSRVCQLVGGHQLLLVLDGVADVKAPAGVAELLTSCPGVRAISTSRKPWQIAGVQSTVLPPLATPGPQWETSPSLEHLASVPSIRLLVDRFAEVVPGFALTASNAGAAVRICRRLDGLPAALEAAAGRSRVLSLQQLAEAPMGDLLDMPVPGRTPELTIGALVGPSIERLDVKNRAVLRELATFDGTWPVPEVATALRRSVAEVVTILDVLIGHGLVRASSGEPAGDFHVPNLLRALLYRTAIADIPGAIHIRGVVPPVRWKAHAGCLTAPGGRP